MNDYMFRREYAMTYHKQPNHPWRKSFKPKEPTRTMKNREKAEEENKPTYRRNGDEHQT